MNSVLQVTEWWLWWVKSRLPVRQWLWTLARHTAACCTAAVGQQRNTDSEPTVPPASIGDICPSNETNNQWII